MITGNLFADDAPSAKVSIPCTLSVRDTPLLKRSANPTTAAAAVLAPARTVVTASDERFDGETVPLGGAGCHHCRSSHDDEDEEDNDSKVLTGELNTGESLFRTENTNTHGQGMTGDD